MTRRLRAGTVVALTVVATVIMLLAAAGPAVLDGRLSVGAYAYDGNDVPAPPSDRESLDHPADQGTHRPTAILDAASRRYDDSANLARISSRPSVEGLAPQALSRGSLPSPADAADLVRGARPTGSALKGDVFHRSATWAVDDISSNGSVYRYVGGDGVQRTLVRAPGELNRLAGRFEWIVDDAGNLTHQMFVKGGSINGLPIRP